MRKIALLALGLTCVSAPVFAQTTTSSLTGGVPRPITGVPNPITPLGVDPRATQQLNPTAAGVPNSLGGYTVYGRQRLLTRVVPNSLGGYTVYGRQGLLTRVVPNSLGGYNVYGRQGLITRVVPNSNGGYTIYGSNYYAPCFAPGYGWYPCPHVNCY
jgi:hypothetical protein